MIRWSGRDNRNACILNLELNAQRALAQSGRWVAAIIGFVLRFWVPSVSRGTDVESEVIACAAVV